MGAKIRVVRRRIRSVQSTMKITRAMELIASSRIVKAQKRVEEARPYAIQLTAAMEDVARQTGSIAHPLLEAREHPGKVGVFVVTSDRGLAGSYNSNVLKLAEQRIADVAGRGLEPVVYVSGKKGVGYLRFRGVDDPRGLAGPQRGPPLRDRAGDRTAPDRRLRRGRDRRAVLRLHGLPVGVHAAGDDPAVPADRARRGHGLRRRGERRVPVRTRAGADPRAPAAPVPGHQGVRGAAGVGGVGERGAAARDEGRHRER